MPCCQEFSRFLAFYTLILTALYSVISYKTPWCLLSFLHGMILLAGIGAWIVLRGPALLSNRVIGLAVYRTVACGALLAGAAHLGWECYALSFRFHADQRNPWVYVHTSGDVLKLAAFMERLSDVSPEGHDMVVHVVSPEYWPLPWYLRQFNRGHTGYWQDAATWARETAGQSPPSVVILDPDLQEGVDSNLGASYQQGMFYGLRPQVKLLVYVRQDLWQAFAKRAGEGISGTMPENPGRQRAGRLAPDSRNGSARVRDWPVGAARNKTTPADVALGPGFFTGVLAHPSSPVTTGKEECLPGHAPPAVQLPTRAGTLHPDGLTAAGTRHEPLAFRSSVSVRSADRHRSQGKDQTDAEQTAHHQAEDRAAHAVLFRMAFDVADRQDSEKDGKGRRKHEN
jgi:hypothetical protein